MIADHYRERDVRWAINPDTELGVTCGGTKVIFAAIAAILEPGDEVIVPGPSYEGYAPIASCWDFPALWDDWTSTSMRSPPRFSRNVPLRPCTDSYAFLDADYTIIAYMRIPNRVRIMHIPAYADCILRWRDDFATERRGGHRRNPLRRDSAGSAKRAAGFVAEAIGTARQAGATVSS